jgi:hypothetical protein
MRRCRLTAQFQTAVLRIEAVPSPPVPRKSHLPRHHKSRPIDQQRASLACLATKKVIGSESVAEIPNFIRESMPPQLLSAIPHRQRFLRKSQPHGPMANLSSKQSPLMREQDRSLQSSTPPRARDCRYGYPLARQARWR